MIASTGSISDDTQTEPAINGSAGHANDRLADSPLSKLVGSVSERSNWILMLEAEAAQMLSSGKPEVMDALGKQFESALIKTALKHTHGRKNDAAIRLGIGRNTITRKIQELGIEGGKDD
jgi:two-component system nitrogen regulation response regulator GlnG